MKAKRHYEAWSINEARNFINYYLSNVTLRDYRLVLEQFASQVDRTYDAISFRQKEVLSILTDAEHGLPKGRHTKEFIQAVEEKLKEGSISKARMIDLFH